MKPIKNKPPQALIKRFLKSLPDDRVTEKNYVQAVLSQIQTLETASSFDRHQLILRGSAILSAKDQNLVDSLLKTRKNDRALKEHAKGSIKRRMDEVAKRE